MRNLSRAAVAVAACIVVAPAPASDFAVGVNLVSLHSEPGYETVTPGLYVRSTGAWFGEAGILRNSYGFTTVHAGVGYSYRWNAWDASILIGASYGYRERQEWIYKDGSHAYYTYGPPKVLPLVAPSVGYRFDDRWAGRVFVLPPVRVQKADGETSAWCLSLAVEYHF